VEQLAPHEKIFIDSDYLKEDPIHGGLACQSCHGGDASDSNWKTAHKGLVKDPSYPDPSKSCGMCHAEIAKKYSTSLHATLSSYKKTINMRLSRDTNVRSRVDTAMERHCMSCHSSCGECHVSRPKEVGGGLLDAHRIQKTPPMKTVCTACHGSRVDREYFGKNAGIPPDIHKQKYFKCTKCHTGDELHGDGVEYDNRYEVANSPKCASCHESIFEQKAVNTIQHNLHKNSLSCQVCHAMPYKNCYSCHVGTDGKGLKFFKTEPSTLDFKIGLNPVLSERRPEKFVVLRHVPIDQDTFRFYTEDGLTNFDSLPTWKMATPHTIRRKTPQNETCNNCHGNADLFLRARDVKRKYLNANKKVIVPPEMIPGQK